MPNQRNTAAGFRNSFIGFTDDDGVLIGSSPTRPTPGTGSGMLRIWAVKRAAATVPTPDVVIDEGDDGEVLTEYTFRSIASRAFIVEAAAQDPALAAVLQDVPVRSLGNGKWVVYDTDNAPIYNMCAILQSRMIDIDNGDQGWSGIVIPRMNATYLGRAEFGERAPGVFRFFVTPLATAWSPLGYTFLGNDNSPRSVFYDEFRGYNNPVTMQAFTGNGSLAIIPVDHAPVNALPGSVFAANTPPSGQGATEATVSSVSPSGKTITLSGAPAQGVRNVELYEYTGN